MKQGEHQCIIELQRYLVHGAIGSSLDRGLSNVSYYAFQVIGIFMFGRGGNDDQLVTFDCMLRSWQSEQDVDFHNASFLPQFIR